jgi:hypothetical protein
MDSLPCPRCGYLCAVRSGRWRKAAACPHCRKRFTIKTQWAFPPWSRLGPALILLAVALVLAAPAIGAAFQTGGDVNHALHGGPDQDAVRYRLYGSVAALVAGAYWLFRRRRDPLNIWPSD